MQTIESGDLIHEMNLFSDFVYCVIVISTIRYVHLVYYENQQHSYSVKMGVVHPMIKTIRNEYSR